MIVFVNDGLINKFKDYRQFISVGAGMVSKFEGKMKKLVLIFSAVLVYGCANITTTNQAISIEGEWNLLSETLTIGDEKYTTFDSNSRKMIKIFTDSHFAFSSIGSNRERFDSYQLTDQQKITAFDNFGGAMGRYTFSNSILTEHIQFSSFPNYEGMSIPFKITIESDTMIQEGHYPLIELGLGKQNGYLYSIFQRIK